MKNLSILIAVLILLPFAIKAQEKVSPSIKLKSLAHLYFSYAEAENNEDPYGFSIRRLRFKPYGDITKNVKWGFQFALDRQEIKLLDVYVNFTPKKYLNIKVGQFAPPAAKSAALADDLFSLTKMICIERSTVTQNWLKNTGLYAYRALGLKIDGKILNEKLYYGIMISNPVGNSLFTPSIKHQNYTHNNRGYSLWARTEYKPVKELGIGGFGSFGNNKNSDNVDIINTERTSFGTHVVYRENNIVLMTEYITGVVKIDETEMKYDGWYFDFSYKIKKIEPAFRYEFYNPNKANEDQFGVTQYNNYTVGVNFYPYKKIRVQANYVFKTEQMKANTKQLNNNLFYINLQYVFSSSK